MLKLTHFLRSDKMPRLFPAGVLNTHLSNLRLIFGLHVLWTSPLLALHLHCRFETRPEPRRPTERHWKANNIVSMKYEAVLYPNLGARLVEKMKTDSADVRVGPQIKRRGTNSGDSLLHRRSERLKLESGLLSAAWGGDGDILQIPGGYLHTCSVWGRGAQHSSVSGHWRHNTILTWAMDWLTLFRPDYKNKNRGNICTFVSIRCNSTPLGWCTEGGGHCT